MIERLDMLISEAEALAELALFVEEEAEDRALVEMRSAMVALLYVARDRLRGAVREAGRIAARCDEMAAESTPDGVAG